MATGAGPLKARALKAFTTPWSRALTGVVVVLAARDPRCGSASHGERAPLGGRRLRGQCRQRKCRPVQRRRGPGFQPARGR